MMGPRGRGLEWPAATELRGGLCADFESLAAICDSFFPRVMIRRPRRVPVGTVSLTTDFHADAKHLARVGEKHELATARASRFGLGYHDQSAEIWSKGGELLATSHQMVYFKE